MERRSSPRYRVHKDGRFRLADRSAGRSCRIKDLSATGARLDLLQDGALPDAGILEIASLDLGFPVRLRWRLGTECGVEFAGPPFPIPG
ncbi:MAG TPA: PilZ domain-containing protein [Aestuariivirgaceae bacterium]|nr:PilZ domain-containing protein [Aestuariivirgaceae bacterium]